jgi:hypothetical protein
MDTSLQNSGSISVVPGERVEVPGIEERGSKFPALTE